MREVLPKDTPWHGSISNPTTSCAIVANSLVPSLAYALKIYISRVLIYSLASINVDSYRSFLTYLEEVYYPSWRIEKWFSTLNSIFKASYSFYVININPWCEIHLDLPWKKHLPLVITCPVVGSTLWTYEYLSFLEHSIIPFFLRANTNRNLFFSSGFCHLAILLILDGIALFQSLLHLWYSY